tara:strand:+ start:253 stop:441 length:189 start_codon:yes stop_codon:yes gene_type:complete
MVTFHLLRLHHLHHQICKDLLQLHHHYLEVDLLVGYYLILLVYHHHLELDHFLHRLILQDLH